MSEKRLHSIIPDPEHVLALEPEELAGPVLEWLYSHGSGASLNIYNLSMHNSVNEYPQAYWSRLQHAVMESIAWLAGEGLLASVPQSDANQRFLTRRAQQIAETSDLKTYRHGSLLPRELLHKSLGDKVWTTFLRGDYDTAVFQSFKEVEVRVRRAGGFSATDLGTKLMRKAFDIDAGPLTDLSAVSSERQAIADLFAGSIGLYKNPSSHRDVQIEAADAVEMILLASHLLKIVDARAAAKAVSPPAP